MEIGRVEQINIWRNSTGFYFKVAGRKFFSYGKPSFMVGSEIHYLLTGRKDKNGNFEAKVAMHPPEIQIFEHHAPQTSANRKDATITRLACLKAAAISVINKNWTSAKEITDLAEKFERWAKEA